MAAMYAIYHGPAGLDKISTRANGMACVFAEGAPNLPSLPRLYSYLLTEPSSDCLLCNSTCHGGTSPCVEGYVEGFGRVGGEAD